MSETAERYKLAEELVLTKWTTERDSKGQCQKWKVKAVKDDRANKIDSGVLNIFVEEVEKIVTTLETVPTVLDSNKNSDVSPSRKVAVEPITPHI